MRQSYKTIFACIGLTACSAGGDMNAFNRKVAECGAAAEDFRITEGGSGGVMVSPVPAGDIMGSDASPEAKQCVLDWARENGFQVGSASQFPG